jgi:uncharacterized protein (DUF302 family)
VRHFLYTVGTTKSFEAAVEAVEELVTEQGYLVVDTYEGDVPRAAEGPRQDSLRVIEVCNARHVSEILKRDVSAALMLPCPIVVYTNSGKTFISTMRPAAFIEFSPGSGLERVASQMETAFLQIVRQARG